MILPYETYRPASMKERKGKEGFAFHLGKVEAGGGEMIRICLTVCPTLEPKHEADLLLVAILK